jgi:hypothetical protein
MAYLVYHSGASWVLFGIPSPMPLRNAVPVISEAIGLVEASSASSEP